MARSAILGLAGAALAVGAAIAAAPKPAALFAATPGLWEIAGIEGAKGTRRECVADLGSLLQFEHRRNNSCRGTVLRDGASSAEIEYNCPGGGFGRSKLTVITPRSLKIETQGISDNLPFRHVLQARRVGDCPERG